MISSFEVGAVFKILDEASPALRKILAQVRELNKAIEGLKANMSALGRNPALVAAIDETKGLALAWREVQKASTSANRSINAASKRSLAGPGVAGVAEAQQLASAWERIAVASAASRGAMRGSAAAATAGGGGGGNRGLMRPGARGGHGGGAHISSPAIGIPGGAHVRFGGNMGGAAMGAAGLLGYGAYEAAQMEDAVFQLIYHSGGEQNDTNRGKFRKILQDSMAESGYSLHDVAESAKQEIRMFQGTPGGGIDVLPEMLRAATIESRLKGESPEESMKALIGLAHMTKQYSPEQIKKLAPAFAFLSTANPSSLGSIEKAAGYAVPIMQSGLEIDPMQTLLLGTALTRAGATSTKSGTWLREMALRAMPGTSMMSKIAFKKHEEALKAFGLVDDKDNPTWFTDGKPDLMKMLRIGHEHANAIPLEKRASYERALFGAQGGGGFALLADDAVYDQINRLGGEMNSPEFKNRYAGFVQQYQQGSTVQNARTAIADFNNTMMDIGAHTLPAVNGALRDFKALLDRIRDSIPGMGSNSSVVGTRALEGAAAGAAGGAVIGSFGGPIGALGGAAIGGVAGVAAGYIEQQAAINKEKWKAEEQERSKAALAAIRGQSVQGGVFPGGTRAAPPPNITLNLNVDGRALGQAISESGVPFNGFPTQAPAADGTGQFYGGDHNFPDK